MLNQCNFIGRLGDAPDQRHTNSGMAVTNFSIACSERWTDKDGEKHEETEWVRVVTWNKLAEFCGNYLTKGSLVYVSGKQKTRKWQDQQGNDKYTTEIIAQTVQSLTPKSENTNRPDGRNPQPNTGEDVPF